MGYWNMLARHPETAAGLGGNFVLEFGNTAQCEVDSNVEKTLRRPSLTASESLSFGLVVEIQS